MYKIKNVVRAQYKKKKESLTFATAWVNFKSVMLREISQTQKDKYCMISLSVESVKQLNS